MVKSVGKYDLYKTLGQGSFGKVKYAVNRETNEAVAIKILDKDKIQKKNMGAQIKKEISIMKMISHKQIVVVKDVFATATKIFIVLELVEGGELFDKIANDGKLPEDQARFYFAQLLEGIEYCHNNNICHRDLKPENLLLDVDGNIKISDFGLATLYIGDATAEGSTNRTELLHTTCGTPNYVAPEVLSNQGYDGRYADIWSMGVILYVLLAGFLPFEEKTIAALFSKIKAADYSYPSWFSSEAKALLDGILVANPAKRFTLEQVKNHPWNKGAMTNPKFPIQKIPSSSYMMTDNDSSSKKQPVAVNDIIIKDEEIITSSRHHDDDDDVLLPPLPPKSPSMSQGRGSFFSGGVSLEQPAAASSSSSSNAKNDATTSHPTSSSSSSSRATYKAPPPKSVFACFCAPFMHVDASYDQEAASPAPSPTRQLPVA